MSSPATVSPPFGTILGNPTATGGYMRRLSFKQASMYGKSLTELNVMSLSFLKHVLTSLVRIASLSWFAVSKNKAPDKRVAVVSEPARMSFEALTAIFAIGICYQS
jgi:hypothetical protein